MVAYYNLYRTISSNYKLKVVKVEVLNSNNQMVSVDSKTVNYISRNVKSFNIRIEYNFIFCFV